MKQVDQGDKRDREESNELERRDVTHFMVKEMKVAEEDHGVNVKW